MTTFVSLPATQSSLTLTKLHSVFAMAPLGIITALISAIRVGGHNWLRTLIGRARENTADAELEIMSSVSHEICELWNGNSIIRTAGKPQVTTIIHLPKKEGDVSPMSFVTLDPKTWSKDKGYYRLAPVGMKSNGSE